MKERTLIVKMPYYRTCPLCGAALDPGERCDCQDKEEAAPVLEHRNGQADQNERTLKDPPPFYREMRCKSRRNICENCFI